MDYARPDALVSTDWLAARLDAPDMRLVDGSFYLPAQKRDPKAEFDQQHIPGAVFFDIDEIADTINPLPHMLPSPEKFSSRVRKLGLGDGNKIVIYDTTPDDGCVARVVDVPRHGPQGRVDSRRRPAQMDGRGPAGHRRSDAAP